MAFLPDLERWARQLTTQPSDAKDLVQETYRRALEAHQQFHPGSDLRAWLGCILRNLHRDRLRRSWREISMGGDDVCVFAAPTPEPRPLWAMVSDEELDRALVALAPVYRTPYVLHTVHGRSYSEIAKQIGIPSGTIGSRIHRARALLRRYLVSGGEEGREDGAGAGARGRRAGRPPRTVPVNKMETGA
ncbi:MAG TPA: RNA polymerase sigma factor [Polyangia bacterium]|nr:RNA polymerase sigma factor [Polyangia bacterium]